MDSGAKVKNTFILSARIKSGACHKNQMKHKHQVASNAPGGKLID